MKAIVQVVLVAVIAAIVIGGFVLNVLLGSEMNLKEMARETEIIKAINVMESIKRGLPYGLYYSYLEALNMNGYTSYVDVTNKDEFKANFSFVFQQYKEEIRNKTDIVIPSGDFDLSFDEDVLTISLSSSNLLTYEYESADLSFKISDSANATAKIRNGQLLE